jgi:hypothetical protein
VRRLTGTNKRIGMPDGRVGISGKALSGRLCEGGKQTWMLKHVRPYRPDTNGNFMCQRCSRANDHEVEKAQSIDAMCKYTEQRSSPSTFPVPNSNPVSNPYPTSSQGNASTHPPHRHSPPQPYT